VAQRKALFVGNAAGPEQQAADVFRRLGFGAPETAPAMGDVLKRLRDEPVDVVVVPLQGLDDAGLATLGRELGRVPGVMVIGTAPQASPDLILRAMRAGLHEFLVHPPSEADLTAAVQRLVQRMPRAEREGKIVAVYSAKGGLGATSVAVNLACSFARAQPAARVALADLVVGGGEVAMMLDLRSAYDVGDLVSKLERVDTSLLDSLLAPSVDGVRVLPATEDLESSDLVDGAAVSTIMAELRANYDFTVVDCEHHLTERTLVALDSADRVVIVTQLSVAALRSAQRTLALCRQLGYEDDKVAVVVNRWQANDLLSAEDAVRVLDREVYLRLPNDYRASEAALTRGVPVSAHQPATPLARAYAILAARLAGTDSAQLAEVGAAEPAAPSRFGRLFGKGKK
jgi:pilus assembly protein CpaE